MGTEIRVVVSGGRGGTANGHGDLVGGGGHGETD